MSIAGISKEVATIAVSPWLFGDQLTPLNITGVAVSVSGEFSHIAPGANGDFVSLRADTFQGIGLYTYHKYRKSIDSTIPLDAHGNPVVEDEGTNADPALRSGQYTVLDERQPLTRLSVDVEGRMSSEGAEIHVSSHS